MTDFKERRNYPRVRVEGAQVAYKRKAGFDLFNRYSPTLQMKDLAKGGICFETGLQLERGLIVEIKLALPGEKTINVKGKIVWSEDSEDGNTFAGVQFLPFGKGKQYNSFECWEKLEDITKSHAADGLN